MFSSPKLDIQYETSLNEQQPCTLCAGIGDDPTEQNFDVTRYPRKSRKKPPKESRYVACILSRMNLETSQREFLLCRFGRETTNKRRVLGDSEKFTSMPTGLASLWQIPQEEWFHTDETVSDSKAFEKIDEFLRSHFKIFPDAPLTPINLGTITHKLSHMHQIFDVWHLDCSNFLSMNPLIGMFSYRWIDENELNSDQRSLAISTGSLKMFMLLDNFRALRKSFHLKKIRSINLEANHKLSDYFTPSQMKTERG